MEADDHVSLFRFPFKIPTFRGIRKGGVYLSGALYALGFWIFLDAVLYSRYSNASDVHVTFIDWIPFLCSTLGTLIVNSIEKNRLLQGALSSDGGAFGSGVGDLDSSMAWQARTVLFLALLYWLVGYQAPLSC